MICLGNCLIHIQYDAVGQYGWANILQFGNTVGQCTAVGQYGWATYCSWAIWLGNTVGQNDAVGQYGWAMMQLGIMMQLGNTVGQ